MIAGSDLAPALGDPEAAVALAAVVEVGPQVEADGEASGHVGLDLQEVVAAPAGRELPGRVDVACTRASGPVRGGGDGWDQVALVPGTRLLVALRAEGAGWRATDVVPLGAAEQAPHLAEVAAARAAAVDARGGLEPPRVVERLARGPSLGREALLVRLERPDVPSLDAVAWLAAALERAPDERTRVRLGLALARRFDPERWADRVNAAVVTAQARALVATTRAERLPWALDLARCLRWPFDPAPERQERVARALVLLVDVSPVEVVAALEGLAGAGGPDEQAAVRDVLALWLQL